jgi:hypothetical protein
MSVSSSFVLAAVLEMHFPPPHAEAHGTLRPCVRPSFQGRPSSLLLRPPLSTSNLRDLPVFGSLSTQILGYSAIRIAYPHTRPSIDVFWDMLCWRRVLRDGVLVFRLWTQDPLRSVRNRRPVFSRRDRIIRGLLRFCTGRGGSRAPI